MNKTYLFLFVLFALSLTGLVPTANAALYYSTVTIEAATGGYTSPGPGTYYYPAAVELLKIYAYHYEGYSFEGWMVAGEFWATAYNPIEISLNIGSTNVTYSVRPVFSTEPHYVLSLTSNDSISIYINSKLEKALNTTSLLNILGGTTVTVAWPTSDWYQFTSYLVNGTDTITTASFSFIMNGNTSIVVDEEYVPSVPITPAGWMNYIAPTAICLILGYGFSTVGERMDHSTAGFFIGGGIGLFLCAYYSLLPVWVVTVGFIFATILGYFWFRGNS